MRWSLSRRSGSESRRYPEERNRMASEPARSGAVTVMTFSENLCWSPELSGSSTLGFRKSGGVAVGAGEALQVLFGRGARGVERRVLGPDENLGIASALHDTVVDLRVESLIAAEIGEEISPAQSFVADHGVGALRA